jgi:hypothetical protein
VFVTGTGNPPHARGFFRAAVAAIERVRRRGSNASASASVFFESGRKNAATAATAATPSASSTHSLPECLASRASALLLTRHPETALSACPTPLPPHVLALPWADLRHVLPNCACLVHNAGVGSVALALELGAAQVLAPAGFDQPENAERARALVDAPVVPMRVFADAGRVEDVADALEFAAKTRHAMDAMEAMREGGTPRDGGTATVETVEEAPNEAAADSARGSATALDARRSATRGSALERRRTFAGFQKIFGFPRLGRALARWFERRSGAPRDDARAFAAARKSMRVAARAAEERRAAGAPGARRAAAFAAGARF